MHNNTLPIDEQEKYTLERIRQLSPIRLTEVLDFVDFISKRDHDRELVMTAGKMSEEAFMKVWDNPEDDVYDRL